MKCKLSLVVMSVLLSVAGLALRVYADELVKGWYDPANDWFVFEWNRPDEGTIIAIDDPPNKIEPQIISEIGYNEDTLNYDYGYTITNRGGKQLLEDIYIENIFLIYDAKAPTAEWYMNWYRTKDVYHWAKTDGELQGIPAGETVKGFSFKSKGIPAITNAAFFGERRERYSPPGDFDSFETMYSFQRVADELEKQYPDKFMDVVLRTLGPTAPPKELNPVAFINGIISMKHEAYTLGWITNKGIETSLDQKLDNAKKKLEQGNNTAAKNILNAFINEVEAQGCESYETKCPEGRHLKPEAYALLKYNAQYLVDNLK